MKSSFRTLDLIVIGLLAFVPPAAASELSNQPSATMTGKQIKFLINSLREQVTKCIGQPSLAKVLSRSNVALSRTQVSVKFDTPAGRIVVPPAIAAPWAPEHPDVAKVLSKTIMKCRLTIPAGYERYFSRWKNTVIYLER